MYPGSECFTSSLTLPKSEPLSETSFNGLNSRRSTDLIGAAIGNARLRQGFKLGDKKISNAGETFWCRMEFVRPPVFVIVIVRRHGASQVDISHMRDGYFGHFGSPESTKEIRVRANSRVILRVRTCR